MADTRRSVERIVESDPVIKKGLQRGIINSRALAKYIIEANGVDTSQDAILGILRRYTLDGVNEEHRKAFNDCEISTRSRMADLAVENGPDIMERIAEFAATVRTTRGENLRVIVGLQSIRVIADQKTLESFRQTLQPKEVISYSTDLVELSLLFGPGYENNKGLVAKVTAQLALHDVNLAGMLVCPPEDIVMVAEKDASRALEALNQLLQEETAGYPRGLVSWKGNLSKRENDHSSRGEPSIVKAPRNQRRSYMHSALGMSQNRSDSDESK